MIKPIIFLDIDGVLNHNEFYKNRPPRNTEKENPLLNRLQRELDPSSVAILNNLVKETGAKIVISSTWRLIDNWKYFIPESLKLNGFEYPDSIIDQTPCIRHEFSLRGNEILMWIKNNQGFIGAPYYEYSKYVIFDDDSDMLYWQKDNFIHVDRMVGITVEDAAKAKTMLTSECCKTILGE